MTQTDIEVGMDVAELLRVSTERGERVLFAWDERVAITMGIDDEHPNMGRYGLFVRFDENNKVIEVVDLSQSLEEVVEALAPRFDAKEFLRQTLADEGSMKIMEIAKVIKKHPEVAGKVESKRGCLFLHIPNPEPGADSINLYLKG